MAFLVMIPTLLLLLCAELVPLLYCSVMLAKIVLKIGGNDKLLILLSVLIILSVVIRFVFELLWLINLFHGHRNFLGLHHSCLINMTYFLPMLSLQMVCSLVNLSIWGYFIASIYFIQNKLYYLLLWARKRIVLSLVLVSLLIVVLPIWIILLVSCLLETHPMALDIYGSVCSFLLLLCYIILGRKLLQTLQFVFKGSYKKIRR